ncbi:hypothetical protein HB779_07030 [Phyllobacterium sp. 628]|uniref:hypothetical protein n=1 Tax=Phyllobacterium sp. 628 TaxID=2718938 RepID=UPI001662813B|nr:hypothetical protein [Phyllobacterium sp. 628]QND51680.1 hypothetical protein HB779_07030 [Phyllobacterium sp. 628]
MSIDKLKVEKRLTSLMDPAARLNKKILSRELDLMITKWSDYQFLSPYEATKVFIIAYRHAFKSAVKTHRDINEAAKARGIDSVAMRERSSEFTQMWVARQNADTVGLPYDIYLQFCFDFAMRKKRRRLPRPNQLFWNKKTEIAWKATLAEFMTGALSGGSLRPNALPQYRIEAYRGLVAQDLFRSKIIELTKKSVRPLRNVIEDRSLIKRQMPIELFSEVYGAYAFENAVRSLHAENKHRPILADPYVAPDQVDLWQSCFAAPWVRDMQSVICSSCPAAESCKRLGGYVLSQIKEKYGTDDPVGEIERSLARKRQSNKRALAKVTGIKPSGTFNLHAGGATL